VAGGRHAGRRITGNTAFAGKLLGHGSTDVTGMNVETAAQQGARDAQTHGTQSNDADILVIHDALLGLSAIVASGTRTVFVLIC
nr:hypothetical protein [Tanacetum cinerariifolium]